MSTRSGYNDIEIIRDPDGIIAIISQRISNKMLSVAVMKEYPRDDKVERTCFFSKRHIPAAMRVLEIAEKRLAVLEEEQQQAYAAADTTRSA